MKAKPFVKWAGGKGSLIPQLEKHFPKDLRTQKSLTYVEPFLGGGAMLFYMLNEYSNIEKVIANDINHDLISSYKAIKRRPRLFIKKLKEIEKEFLSIKDMESRKERYIIFRNTYNQMSKTGEDMDRACFFMFLNHTCFNGLYRENKKGEFNVPFGSYEKPTICNEELIMNDHKLLQKVEFLCGSYECVYDFIDSKSNTFVYFDPPYRPLSESSNFNDYNSSGFGDEEQIRLKTFCDEVYDKNCKLMLSNSDSFKDKETHFFKELYEIMDDEEEQPHLLEAINRQMIVDRIEHEYNMVPIYAPRFINAFVAKRTKVKEILIRNYH